MKIDDVNPNNRENVVVDKEGTVLCPKCNKEPAWVAWGKVDECLKCNSKTSILSIDEPNGRRIK